MDFSFCLVVTISTAFLVVEDTLKYDKKNSIFRNQKYIQVNVVTVTNSNQFLTITVFFIKKNFGHKFPSLRGLKIGLCNSNPKWPLVPYLHTCIPVSRGPSFQWLTIHFSTEKRITTPFVLTTDLFLYIYMYVPTCNLRPGTCKHKTTQALSLRAGQSSSTCRVSEIKQHSHWGQFTSFTLLFT